MLLRTVIFFCVLLAGGGCAPKAATELRPVGDEAVQVGDLTIEQRREALRAMASVDPDHRPTHLPRPRLRWEDVQRAAELATAELEMAIARRRKSEDEWVFTVKTIEDRRGELIVARVNGPEVYRAAARIGEMEIDERRAAQLLEQFALFMRRLGEKRHVSDPR